MAPRPTGFSPLENRTQRRAFGWALGRWHALAAGLALLAIVYGTVSVVASRRGTAIRIASDAARVAVREARAAEAMTWAPDELTAAERASREALAAQRLEETGFWPVPDAARLLRAYAEAERAARGALTLARTRRAEAEGGAASQIEEAGAAVSSSETLALTIHVGAARRRLLAEARSALEEARAYQREGDFKSAAVRARQATALAMGLRDDAAAVAARYADAETVAQWQRWKADTIAWSRREGRAAIVVFKEAHLLTLYVRGEPVKTYQVDLSVNWIADKSLEGDRATPEGRYRVVKRMANLASIYYKALLLDYPNADDRARFSRGRRSGEVPPSARIGGLIEIHGGGGRRQDWTTGCIALANTDMDDVFGRVDVGTPVTIVGNDDYGALAEFAAKQRNAGASRRP